MSQFCDARTLLKRYGLAAKKSWGQNFLVDERTYSDIVNACKLDEQSWVVEIGAGLGTLTARLAEVAGHVIAVERDRDMVAVLRAEHGDNPRIEIAEANALTFDVAAVAKRAGGPVTAVGNLPYQIASPLLFKLFEVRTSLTHIVVMLQREMAERILAPAGDSRYGALSVMVQMLGTPSLVRRVKAGAFVPAPRVESAVIKVVPFANGATRTTTRDFDWFSKIVHASFEQRRKMLRKALSTVVPVEPLTAAFATTDIDGQRRGETLSVEEFAALADATWDLAHA